MKCKYCGRPSRDGDDPVCDQDKCIIALVMEREAMTRPRSESWQAVAKAAARHARRELN